MALVIKQKPDLQNNRDWPQVTQLTSIAHEDLNAGLPLSWLPLAHVAPEDPGPAPHAQGPAAGQREKWVSLVDSSREHASHVL